MVASGTSSELVITPVTDYFSSNRLWTVGSGDVTGIVYRSRVTAANAIIPPTEGILFTVLRHIILATSSITSNLHYGANDGPNSIYVDNESADSDVW